MDPKQSLLKLHTRRHFFQQCGLGVGKIALASLLSEGRLWAGSTTSANPLAPQTPHFPARVKNVIFLFMAGGPSQLELFDYKPRLQELNGQPIPESYLKGKRFAFMDTFTKQIPKLLGARRKFARHGQSGTYVSELLPYLSSVVDDVAMLPAVATEVFNHAPAKVFINTGTAQFGRPSIGAWVTYGLGSESQDLPGFVVLQSGPRGPRGGSQLWSSGFLPTMYQGVPFRSGGEPILDLTSPRGINPRRQGQAVEAIRDLNRVRLEETGDPEISTPDRRLRNGLPNADECAGADRLGGRNPPDVGPVRRGAGEGVVCQQLFTGPAPGRTGRALRAALSHRLGPSRRAGGRPGEGAREGLSGSGSTMHRAYAGPEAPRSARSNLGHLGR
jgi:hypothetical protein